MRQFFRYILGLRRIRFVQEVLTNQVSSSIYTVATLLASIIFARALGAEHYGLYAVTLAFVATANTLLNIGQGPALAVFFAEEYGQGDLRGMSRVLRNFAQVSIVNGMILLFLALAAPSVSETFYGTREIGRFARVLFLFHAVDIWNSMVLIILQAVRKIPRKVVLEQAANLSFLSLATLSLLLGGGIGGILGSQLAASLMFLPISFWNLRVAARELHLPSLRGALAVHPRETLPYLGQGFLIALDKNIGNYFPQGLFFLLSIVASPTLVGFARIGSQIAALPRNILLPHVVGLSTTVFAHLRAKSITEIRHTAMRITTHAFAVHLLTSVGAALATPFLIPLLYGTAFAEAIPLTLWLLLLTLPASLCTVNSPLLRLFRKIHYSTLQSATTWIPMAAVFLLTPHFLTVESAFLVAYGLGLAMPVILTVYLFRSFLAYPLHH